MDQALWDIKGKMAGMPVYDLLGGRAREAAAVYVHASGREPAEVADKVSAFMDQGFHHIRVQVDTPGYATYGTKGLEKKAETGACGRRGASPGNHLEQGTFTRASGTRTHPASSSRSHT